MTNKEESLINCLNSVKAKLGYIQDEMDCPETSDPAYEDHYDGEDCPGCEADIAVYLIDTCLAKVGGS